MNGGERGFGLVMSKVQPIHHIIFFLFLGEKKQAFTHHNIYLQEKSVFVRDNFKIIFLTLYLFPDIN